MEDREKHLETKLPSAPQWLAHSALVWQPFYSLWRILPCDTGATHLTYPTSRRHTDPHIVMAKIFYTIEEACGKLGKNNGQVMDLIKSGKLREFRDRGQLMLKVEDVNSIATDVESDDGLDLKMGSDMVNLGGESDSFELDLTDSASPATIADPKGDSPVGLTAPQSIEDDLSLELDSMSSAEISAPAAQSSAGSDVFSLELDDLDSPSASAAPVPAAKSAAAIPAMLDDELPTLELDLSDSLPAPAVAAPKIAPPAKTNNADLDMMSLEDSLASGVAQSPAKSSTTNAANDFEQTIEDSREGSAIGFDSRVDSAVGASVGLEADQINLDQPGSGSGLLDLTQESEDSQMGAALMDEAFQGDDEEAPKNASGIFGGASGESGIHDAPIVNTGSIAVASPVFAAAMSGSEMYSGSWSGMTIGLLVPAIVGLSATASMLVMKTIGATPELAMYFAKDWVMWTGGYAASIAICGAIGFFVGKATE